ncbi:MAG: hypothetical protein AAGA85_10255, partial [Bacteroidota bacterium]
MHLKLDKEVATSRNRSSQLLVKEYSVGPRGVIVAYNMRNGAFYFSRCIARFVSWDLVIASVVPDQLGAQISLWVPDHVRRYLISS